MLAEGLPPLRVHAEALPFGQDVRLAEETNVAEQLLARASKKICVGIISMP